MAGNYLMYLRKSRKDRELEQETGRHDTLERHRSALLALAERQGLTIAGIYEEVVTGDTIAERPEMQRLLAAVETGRYDGVLVMEVPHLARGNTRDQGVISETFQYSGTKIITPEKTYDTLDDADEEYFEFGLFMSRREYKAINRRLNRGRMASLQEGKYIAGTAPYGYEKYKLTGQKGYSLRIVPDQAEVVRRIYHLYTVGAPDETGIPKPIGSYRIANQLSGGGIPSPGGVRWTATAVRDILKNPVYAGMLRWAYRPVIRKVEGGVVTTSTPVSDHATVVNGMHEAIVPRAVWDTAQRMMAASVPPKKMAANPLAGILFCAECGRAMVQTVSGHGTKIARLVCPTPGCQTVSHRTDRVEAALLDAMRRWLSGRQLRCSGEAQPQPDAGTDPERLAVQQLTRSLEQLRAQQLRLCDLLEQGVYTTEVFVNRTRLLAGRIAAAEQALAGAEAAAQKKGAAERIRRNVVPDIEQLLSVYHSLDSAADRNALLRHVLEKVLYKKMRGKMRGSSPSGPALFLFPSMGGLDSDP